jgi:threonylcarbamoyladenosine tRNA methylthiotransferase MtaB
MSVDVITFGCRLNAQESEVIREQAQAAGLADTVVVNTCAVTAEAVRQSQQAIRRIRRRRPNAQIVVTGCAAQIEPSNFAAMPEVSLVLGNEEKLSARVWQAQRAAGGARGAIAAEEKIRVNDIMAVRETAAHLIDGFEGRARAFVQVQNGCDHRCTFCIIPFGRGNSRSVPMGEVVAQIRRLCSQGFREVVLTGVDLTGYGSNVPELARLRLSSIDPVEVDRELLDAFAREARLMPHLHLSLQAGDDLVLRRMKRRHGRADAIALCAQLRASRSDLVLGADLIAGFPTETEEMFARSLDLVDACGLTHLHVFPFSPRPGTPAARMPQVPRETVKRRAQALRAKGKEALRHRLDLEVGRSRHVLVESGERGHTEQFIPVQIRSTTQPGTIVDVVIAGHDGRELLAACPPAC